MRIIAPEHQHSIVINARFLTRRITGLERYAIEISRHLKKIRPSLIFVTPQNVLHHAIAEELGAEVHGTLTGHLWEQLELPFFLRRNNKPVMINLMNTGPITYRNQVTLVHDLAFLRNPDWFSRRAALWFTFLVPRVVNASSVIAVNSIFTKNELMEHLDVPDSKIHLVSPGISAIFHARENGRCRNKTGATILAVSTLDPRKNLARLIEGFKLLPLKDVKLVIVGGSNSLVFGKSEDRNDTECDPRIEYLGYIPDAQLVDLYHEADVFASVSLYEGFGFPPLEAFACGCPVLVSDIPSHREIFGDQVTYVNPRDPSEIAQKLAELLAQRNEGEADCAQRAATLSRFDWQRAAENLLVVVDEFQAT
jgi:glycosyltransferase involved in cell wall biosynthesis